MQVVLRHDPDATDDEIAAACQRSISTVKPLANRVRESLGIPQVPPGRPKIKQTVNAAVKRLRWLADTLEGKET